MLNTCNKILLFLTAISLLMPNPVVADTIFLKSGETVKGEIVYESPVFVRIRTTDKINTQEYLMTLIDHVEKDAASESIEFDPQFDTLVMKSEEIIKGAIIQQTPQYVLFKADGAKTEQKILTEEIERIHFHSGVTPKTASTRIESRLPETAPVKMQISDTKEATTATEDTAEGLAETPTDVDEETEIVSIPNKISPSQKVISRDSPEPYQPPKFQQGQYSTPTYDNLPTDVPAAMDFEEVQNEIARLQKASLANQAEMISKQNIVETVANAPSIYNTEAYNDFMDQVITTNNYKTEDDAQAQSAFLKQMMEARAKTAPGGGEAPFDKLMELLPKVLLAIVIGVGLPVLTAVIFFIMCVIKSGISQGGNKEVNEELESLAKLKEEGKISEEEYENLVNETKTRLSGSPVKAYLQSIPKIFIYPVRGKVLLATLAATVIFYIVRIAMYAPFYGFFATIFAYCYIVACIVKIIETAVREEREDIFDWPSFTEMVDWFGKAFLFLIGWLICHGTALLVFFKLIRYEAIRFPVVSISIALLIIGMFVYPMYILAMSLVGGVASLNIVNIIKAIKTTYISYVLTLFVLFVTQILSGLAQLIPVAGIPLFGSLFKWFIFVYFLLVNMRLLGIFYKTHRLKLQWYDEEE